MDSDDEIEGGENDVNNDWSAPPTRTISTLNRPLCYRLSIRCSEAFMQRTTRTPCAVRGAALLLP